MCKNIITQVVLTASCILGKHTWPISFVTDSSIISPGHLVNHYALKISPSIKTFLQVVTSMWECALPPGNRFTRETQDKLRRKPRPLSPSSLPSSSSADVCVPPGRGKRHSAEIWGRIMLELDIRGGEPLSPPSLPSSSSYGVCVRKTTPGGDLSVSIHLIENVSFCSVRVQFPIARLLENPSAPHSSPSWERQCIQFTSLCFGHFNLNMGNWIVKNRERLEIS